MNRSIKIEEKKYNCKSCNFYTSKKTDYDRHLKTLKHKKKCNKSGVKLNFVCDCGKSYSSRGGLWKHKKKCTSDSDDNIKIVTKEVDDSKNNDTDIKERQTDIKENEANNSNTIDKILEENKQLRETIQELVPKVGNQNNINFNIFLNEKCKDAINISDFVETLNIGMRELEYSKSYGIVEGISSIFVRGLRELDIYKRPIHCAEQEEENKVLYVKDENKWQDDKSKIRLSIENVVQKHIDVIETWERNHPDWSTNIALTEEYLDIVKNVTTISEQSKEKLISDITKEVKI